MNFLKWLMLSLLKCFMKCCSMIFWTSFGCDTYRSWLSCTKWIFWCFMCRAFAALNIPVSSFAFSTSSTRSLALFSLASLTFRFIYLSISFLDFLNCLFFSGSFQFSVCRLMSFCSFNILSRSGSDIWWLFTSSCIRNEFLPHIWLCPWAFPICSLAVLLRMCYSQFLL